MFLNKIQGQAQSLLVHTIDLLWELKEMTRNIEQELIPELGNKKNIYYYYWVKTFSLLKIILNYLYMCVG